MKIGCVLMAAGLGRRFGENKLTVDLGCGETLINYLRSIPASTVEKIELINNPSSHLDAAGKTGVINIEIKRINKYFGDNHVLKNVDLQIQSNKTTVIIGSSGSGKSTLIKLILKEEEPTKGNIIINGKDTTFLKPKRIPFLRRSMGVVFQDFRLLPDRTVYDNVAYAMYIVRATPKHIRRQVPMILSLVGLSNKAKMYPNELSGGEQQRVAILRALMMKTPYILADEPTGNLDPKIVNLL